MFNACGVSAWGDREVLEMGDGDGCRSVTATRCHRTGYLKMVKMVNFVLCIFLPHRK